MRASGRARGDPQRDETHIGDPLDRNVILDVRVGATAQAALDAMP